jgi:integrase
MSSRYLRGKTWYYAAIIKGKRVQKSLQTDLASVAKQRQAEYDIRYDNLYDIKDIPVATALSLYLEERKHRRASETQKDSERKIRGFLAEKNIVNFRDISTDKMTDYLSHIASLGKSEYTLSNILEYNRIFLKWCVERGYIQSNPFVSIKNYKPIQKTVRFLNSTQIKRVLKEANKEVLYPAVAIAIYAGLRKSEIFHLTPDDIDLKQGIIHVRNKEGFTTKSGKNRVVGISKRLKPILATQLKTGPLFDLHNNRRVMRRIMRNSGVSWAGWHTLRHSFASELVKNGVDVYSVSKILGHASVKITEDTYLHGSPEHQRLAVDRLSF